MANYEESKKKSFSIETILSKDKSRNEKSSARILNGNTRAIQFESKSSEEAPAESSYCQEDCLPIPNTEGSNRSHHGYSQQIDTLMDYRNSTSFTHRKLSNIPTSYSPSKDISDSKLGDLTGSKPKKKTRTVFSRHQIFYLESAFEMKRYLSSTERSEIASTLNLTETQVKVWFQNRRNKWKSQLNGEANLPEERFPAFSFNGQYPLSIGALSTRPPNLQLYPHPLMYF